MEKMRIFLMDWCITTFSLMPLPSPRKYSRTACWRRIISLSLHKVSAVERRRFDLYKNVLVTANGVGYVAPVKASVTFINKYCFHILLLKIIKNDL